jgi:hypothetical protein
MFIAPPHLAAGQRLFCSGIPACGEGQPPAALKEGDHPAENLGATDTRAGEAGAIEEGPMATCASCGKEMRDGDWTCGNCGAPVTGAGASGGAGESPADYHSGYESPPDYGAPVAYGAPAAPAAAKNSLSRSTLTIVIVAALAVVAIIAVWFFFVRGTGGASPFLGTWSAPDGGAATVEVKLKSGDFKVTMTGKDPAGAEKTYTIPAHLDGSSLVVTVDDFIEASGNEDQAAQAKAVFETMIKDFRLVFALDDPTHLKMTVEGTPVGGSAAAQASTNSIVLVKDD